MRIPYVPTPVKTNSEEEAAILARVEARRAPRPLIPLDLALLHSPPVADGWNAFLGAVRTRTSVADDLRELAMCCVAAINGAEFEWNAHAPLAVKAGIPSEVLETLKTGAVPAQGLTAEQNAVWNYASAMTKDVTVSDEVFGKIKDLFSNKEIVEITAIVGAYNCVSRFLVALDVGEMNSK